jgi:hypothetical protein
MKKNKFALIVTVLFFAVQTSFAQRVDLQSGDVDVLAGEKTVNVQYDYSSFGVGKFATEKEYLDKKAAEYNAKESGKGDEWRKSWVADRQNKYEPKFEELFNKGLESKGITVSQGTGAKYTLIVHTTYLEPGYNVGVMRKNAYLNYKIDLVETGTRKSAAEMALTNVAGGQFGGFDFDAGVRIAESYAKAGKILAAFIDKKLK